VCTVTGCVYANIHSILASGHPGGHAAVLQDTPSGQRLTITAAAACRHVAVPISNLLNSDETALCSPSNADDSQRDTLCMAYQAAAKAAGRHLADTTKQAAVCRQQHTAAIVPCIQCRKVSCAQRMGVGALACCARLISIQGIVLAV
jgi:hypothetical protein